MNLCGMSLPNFLCEKTEAQKQGSMETETQKFDYKLIAHAALSQYKNSKICCGVLCLFMKNICS